MRRLLELRDTSILDAPPGLRELYGVYRDSWVSVRLGPFSLLLRYWQS